MLLFRAMKEAEQSVAQIKKISGVQGYFKLWFFILWSVEWIVFSHGSILTWYKVQFVELFEVKIGKVIYFLIEDADNDDDSERQDHSKSVDKTFDNRSWIYYDRLSLDCHC